MLSNQAAFTYYLQKFYNDKVLTRKTCMSKIVKEIARIVFEVLKEVEAQEPRFISQLNEINGRFEGISVISSHEFEVIFMNIFSSQNFHFLFLKRLFYI